MLISLIFVGWHHFVCLRRQASLMMLSIIWPQPPNLAGLKSLVYAIEQPFSLKGKCTQNESGLIVIMKVFYISSILWHAWREVHSNWKGVKSHYFDVLNRSTRWHLQQLTLTGSARCGLVSWFLNVTSPLAYLFRTSKYWDFTQFHFESTSPLSMS